MKTTIAASIAILGVLWGVILIRNRNNSEFAMKYSLGLGPDNLDFGNNRMVISGIFCIAIGLIALGDRKSTRLNSSHNV
jgi:hypothetical protein